MMKTLLPLTRLAVISETALFVVAISWSWIRDIPFHFSPDPGSLATGMAIAIACMCFSLVFRQMSRKCALLDKFVQFEKTVLVPICRGLPQKDILIIALFSGVAEEIFFRGVLDTELSSALGTEIGITLSAMIFAVVHFGAASLFYFPVVILYFLFSLLFSYLYLSTHNLLICIVLHSTYNALALTYYSKLEENPPRGQR